jgi:hypothetical protein
MTKDIAPNRYILVVFGDVRDSVTMRVIDLLPQDYLHYSDSFTDLYSVQNISSGPSDSYLNSDGISLLIHGLAFTESTVLCSSDRANNDLRKIVQDNLHDLRLVPLSIINGSYVAVCSNNLERCGYAYTCFLNSIPLYYIHYDKCLIVSSNFTVLRRISSGFTADLYEGVAEYYSLGTILSSNTGVKGIKSIPKGAWLRYSGGRIELGFYYTMPEEDRRVSFSSWVDEFAYKWDKTIATVQKTHLKYGLGLTGGVDSRLILAGMKDRRSPLFFTGSNPDHPDWLLSHFITQRLGISNHVLEDYSSTDKLRGYAEYCALADNPLNLNHMYYSDKLRFRIMQNLAFELIGLTEFLGGVYHYRDRRSYLDTLRMSGPIKKHPVGKDLGSISKLVILGLRNQIFNSDLDDVIDANQFQNELTNIAELLLPQLGEFSDEESFLERFRHIHKMANLLSWSHLPNRRYLECFSPSMNIELTSLACRIPLCHRDSRKLLFSYLTKYHPELSMFPLSGYGFTPDHPWILYKLLGPQIKVLNHLGLKIPVKQWYLTNSKFKDIDSMPEVYEFQRRICKKSELVRETVLSSVMKRFPNDKLRLMRLFNIALLDISEAVGGEQYERYLLDTMEEIVQESH